MRCLRTAILTVTLFVLLATACNATANTAASEKSAPMNKTAGKENPSATTTPMPARLTTASPAMRSRDFAMHVDNPWFPLRAGSTLVYKGVKDGKIM
jgi:hypothetical protein